MCRYRHVWNIELKLRPAFLGGIMQGSGAKTSKIKCRTRKYSLVPDLHEPCINILIEIDHHLVGKRML